MLLLQEGMLKVEKFLRRFGEKQGRTGGMFAQLQCMVACCLLQPQGLQALQAAIAAKGESRKLYMILGVKVTVPG